MNEAPGTTAQPAWLELPEKSEYWACSGNDAGAVDGTPSKAVWRILSYSKEDAEAYVCIPRSDWRWDRKPAKRFSLQETMDEVRRNGDLGVRIRSFQDGEWRVVKQYHACEPLREIEGGL